MLVVRTANPLDDRRRPGFYWTLPSAESAMPLSGVTHGTNYSYIQVTCRCGIWKRLDLDRKRMVGTAV